MFHIFIFTQTKHYSDPTIATMIFDHILETVIDYVGVAPVEFFESLVDDTVGEILQYYPQSKVPKLLLSMTRSKK